MNARFLDPVRLDAGLRSRGRKAAFLLVVAAIAAGLSVLTIPPGVADMWSDSSDLAQVTRALRLDPRNAGIHHWAGVLYDDAADPAHALAEYRAAVQLNPHKARYWTDLGWACVGKQDLRCATTAFRNAVAAAPSSPRFRWDALNFGVLTRDNAWSRAQVHEYLRLSPQDTERAFDLYMRAFDDPDGLWTAVANLPVAHGTQLTYLAFLARRREIARSSQYWEQFSAHARAIPVAAAAWYLDQLLAAGYAAQAVRVWQQLQQVGSVRPLEPGNLIFNARFDQPPTGAQFDWQMTNPPYVAAAISEDCGDRGVHCLRVDYTVADNLESAPVHQVVPVSEGKTYLLSAQVRSEAITSDSGPRLRVDYPQCPTCEFASSAGTAGTQPWHQVTVVFTAPDVNVATVSIWRPRSRSFPNTITGQFWVRDVVMKQFENAAEVSSASTK